MDQRPSRRFLREYYQGKAASLDEISSTYLHPNWYKSWFYQTRSGAVLRALQATRGERILDVGCGPGYYGRIMAAQGAEVVSIDIASAYLRQGSWQELLGRKICGDAGALPLRDATFSKVLATEVVEHTTEPASVVAEISRVLRPNGVAVITAPSSDSWSDWLYGLKRKIHGYAFNEHLQEFTKGSFRRLLERYLTVQTIDSANFLVPFPLDSLAMRLPRSLQGAFDAVERMLESCPAFSPPGWTMIARCEKS